jgi:hypothetical protein
VYSSGSLRGEALPANQARNLLRASVQGLLEAASPDRLGDRSAAVPQEIRDLLDYLASSAAPPTAG